MPSAAAAVPPLRLVARPSPVLATLLSRTSHWDSLNRGTYCQPSLLCSGGSLSAHTSPNPYSKNLTGELFRKGVFFSSPQMCDSKIKILGLKNLAFRSWGTQEGRWPFIRVESFKVGERVAGGEVECRINLRRLGKLWSWDLIVMAHGPPFCMVISKSDLRYSLF